MGEYNGTAITFGQKTSGAQPGNDNNEKFKTEEQRADFLAAYIKHCQKGLSDRSFSYQRSGIEVLKHYIAKYPLEFSADVIDEAHTARLEFWETIGKNGIVGKPVYYNEPNGVKNPLDNRKNLKIKGGSFNAQAYAFFMQNVFGWKLRTDITSDDKPVGPSVFVDTKSR